MHLKNVLPVALVACALFTFSARGADWTPTRLDTLVWLDAADTSTLWADTNGTVQATNSVARWDDKSGNGNHMLQANSSCQPTFRTINGINALEFDGGNDYMQEETNAFGASIGSAFVFIVLQLDVVTDAGGFFDLSQSGGENTNTWHAQPYSWGGGELHFEVNGAGATQRLRYTPALDNDHTNGVVFLGGFYASDALDTKEIWYDAVLRASSSNTVSAVTTAGGVRTGVEGSGSTLDGAIAEVVIIDGAVTTADRQRLEGYLAWKWDLENKLPAGHPYKNAPPDVPGPLYKFK